MLAFLQQTAMARTALNTLLARDPGTAFTVDTVIPVAEPLELDGLQQAALAPTPRCNKPAKSALSPIFP
jgi:hypothetical protein